MPGMTCTTDLCAGYFAWCVSMASKVTREVQAVAGDDCCEQGKLIRIFLSAFITRF